MILSVESLAFNYPSHTVLQDIRFSISRGDFLAILGVNGADKSTLLKCINRVLKPHAGTVFIKGDEAMKLCRRELAKRIGYVAQRHESAGPLSLMLCCLEGNRTFNGRLPEMIWKLPMTP